METRDEWPREFTIKFKFPSDRDGEEQAIRMLLSDKAFGLIWDLQQKCRNILKYEPEVTGKCVAEDIMQTIDDSGLMEYYN